VPALTRLELVAGTILSRVASEITDLLRAQVARSLVPASASSRNPNGPRKRGTKLIPLREAVAQVEREHIARALAENGGSVIRAARALAVPVTTLKYKLSKYRLR
jgi:DNA-binding NtrC family response regulator